MDPGAYSGNVYGRGVELHHEIAGSGGTVVLIHEGIADSRMWDAQWPSYTERFRTLRYDMRGFGRSPLRPEAFSHGQDLLQLLDSLGIDRAALVGVSMGARVALEVTLARPQLVSALVLVGAAMPAEGWSQAVRSYGAEEGRLVEAGDLDAAAELTVRFWVDGVGRGPEDVDAEVRRKVSEMQRRAYEHWLDVGDAAEERELVEDAGERASEVRAPTLIVVGEHDQADCNDTAERLGREIPGARLERMAATAHAPSMERPEAFDALVVPFLAEHA